MPAYWWAIAAAVTIAVAMFARWLARWTGQHPPYRPGPSGDGEHREELAR